MVNYLALCYGIGVTLAVLMAGYAFVIGYIMRQRVSDTESFLTARHQVGPFRIGWSFFAGAVGAWVIASPASYATLAGLLGLVFYALSSGLPFIMIAFAGDKIRKKVPYVLSLTDYIGWRFGKTSKTFVLALVLFNMSIALLAEYLTIGSIFKDFVGSVPYPMIILVGFLTMAYTAYGGLLVSIYTDQIQGATSLLFFVILGIYMAATFRPSPSLVTPMPCGPTDAFCISGTPNCGTWDSYNEEQLAADPAAVTYPCPVSGYSSILVMPVSLFTATVFSEAMWQKAWASRDTRALHVGALLGATGVVLVVFLAGFCGLLAAWAGLITAETNYNLLLFQVLNGGKLPVSPYVSNWIGVICVVLAVVMNEGAVDSIQNGMAAAITSYIVPIYKKWNLTMTRGVVLVVNIILILVAIWLTGCFNPGGCAAGSPVKIGVLQLFLLANMLCTCAALPVLTGLADRLHAYYGAWSFLFSAIFPMICVSIFGVDYYYTTFPQGFVDEYIPHTYTAGSFADGMFYTWIGNGYAWKFFLVPLGVSAGAILMCLGINALLNKFATKQTAIPGFVARATHPHLFAADPVAGATKLGEDEDSGKGSAPLETATT